MPSVDMTVHKVELSSSSPEYQSVLFRFQATAVAVNIHKIERIQNPHLFQCYMVRKQKMDKDLGGNSERQLFHGTDSRNVSRINAQGFNRSLCGANGKLVTLYCYGRGVAWATICKFSDIVPNLETKGHQGKKMESKMLQFLFTHKRLKGSWK